MSGLAARQEAFIASLLDEDGPFPGAGDQLRAPGMGVYRNAYRARLVDALADTFERTARLAGDEAFRQAAVHHLIVHPPTSWTLDLAGTGFAETCRELFSKDQDVGEIAWLEWAMACAFTAADAEPLSAPQFAAATATFTEADWSRLRLVILPGSAVGPATYDLPRLWRSLEHDGVAADSLPLAEPQSALAWREDELPVFAMVSRDEGDALEFVLGGGSFGELCERFATRRDKTAAAQMAGEMLRHWLKFGLICGIRV